MAEKASDDDYPKAGPRIWTEGSW